MRAVIIGLRVLLAIAAAGIAFVALAAATRPEPGPCRDTITVPASGTPMCVAPPPDLPPILAGAAAALAATWVGSGQVQRRVFDR